MCGGGAAGNLSLVHSSPYQEEPHRSGAETLQKIFWALGLKPLLDRPLGEIFPWGA